MEEILELKDLIQQRDYDGALKLVEELEDMSKKDMINNIHIYAIILILYLIKRAVEKRTTRTWDISITNSPQISISELSDSFASAFAQARRKVCLDRAARKCPLSTGSW